MSLSAFHYTGPLATVLLSDGASYGFKDQKITNLNTRKIWKLTPSAGLCWMGARTDRCEQIVQSVMGMDAKSAIHELSDYLEGTIDRQYFETLNTALILFTFGYNQRKDLEYYRASYVDGKMIPDYKGILRPGMNGEMVEGDNLKLYGNLLQKHKSIMKEPFRTDSEAVKAVQTVSKNAFKEMLAVYKNKNRPVGGRIYCEVIKA